MLYFACQQGRERTDHVDGVREGYGQGSQDRIRLRGRSADVDCDAGE